MLGSRVRSPPLVRRWTVSPCHGHGLRRLFCCAAPVLWLSFCDLHLAVQSRRAQDGSSAHSQQEGDRHAGGSSSRRQATRRARPPPRSKNNMSIAQCARMQSVASCPPLHPPPPVAPPVAHLPDAAAPPVAHLPDAAGSYAGPFPTWQRPSPDDAGAVHAALLACHGAPQQDIGVAEPDPTNDFCGTQVRVLDSLVRTILSQVGKGVGGTPVQPAACQPASTWSLVSSHSPTARPGLAQPLGLCWQHCPALCPQNTTDLTSHRAFASLKQRFPDWDSVRLAPPGEPGCSAAASPQLHEPCCPDPPPAGLRPRPPPQACMPACPAAPGDVADAIRIGGLADIKTARIQNILQTLHAERGECSLEHLRGESDDHVHQQLRRWVGGSDPSDGPAPASSRLGALL